MTILRLKNPTNIYRIDAKKTKRGARLPCKDRLKKHMGTGTPLGRGNGSKAFSVIRP